MGRVQRIDNGADNVDSIVLYQAGVGYLPDGLLQVKIHVDDADSTVLDSDVLGSSVIWWSDTVTVDGVEVPAIRYVGADLGLSPGLYRDCLLRLVTTDQPDGIVWPDPITLVVH